MRIGSALGQARAVEQPVEQDEVFEAGIPFGFEDGFQVKLHVSLAADVGRVAQEAQGASIGDDAPEMPAAVEELLHERVRREARASAGVYAPQLPARPGDVHRRSVLLFPCPVGDGVEHAAYVVGPGVVAQLVPQKSEERDHPALTGEACGGVILRKPFQAATEDLPEVPRISVGCGDLIQEGTPRGKSEICRLLSRQVARDEALQEVGTKESSFQVHGSLQTRSCLRARL